MKKHLYIARHGETEENLKGIIQGQSDGHLSERGRQQVRSLAIGLHDQGIDCILSGDLGRQKETTLEMRAYPWLSSVPLFFTPLLRERGGGDVEGKTYEEFGIEDEEDFNCYATDGKGAFASFESFESVIKRASEGVELLRYLLKGGNVLAVGSGWINSYMVNLLKGEDFVYHEQDNAGVHCLQFDEGEIYTQPNKKFFDDD